MRSLEDVFGTSGQQLAQIDAIDPQTPARTIATTDYLNEPAQGASALLDPKGSAIFWVAAAAVLGLILVTGQVRIEAALGMRGGKSG